MHQNIAEEIQSNSNAISVMKDCSYGNLEKTKKPISKFKLYIIDENR